MDPLSFEFVTVEEAKKVLDGDPPASAQADWSDSRQAPDPVNLSLTPVALRWLAQVPRDVRPLELFATYPRIGNQLAALGNAAAVSSFLADLLIDKRGDRQGFPGGIALELSRLQDYLLELLQPPDIEPPADGAAS
ncbi:MULTISPECIES: hypothetical protein [unclassified Cupriavidus]|uniref:hypothetical protein n=1 Tax=unclassified Cupriavidus TaxID=2640874 RepID=UPI001C002A0F|nr:MULTISPECIES: hypothetical protein [unclassified Cupriavidus]MCA3182626.1 hypothetical protein [Cupriavidus sp.]MCA3193317.1 hypothetical protein [Cupriavidus sp.]MCA3200365.1 hypothetical protein [Cupriavidus sp.]MCA3204429.1 hypothetical protein [Cupriavidus sp.]MCA3205915.1 hypothetical protein [Cupriavidus sp.]